MKRRFTKLALLLVAVLASVKASAYDFTVDGLYYNIVSLQDLTCAVTNDDVNDTKYSGDIVIPEQVTYNGRTLTVTSIGNDAFWRCSGLTSVSIPNSVTSIGDETFLGCSGLTSISIPSSVTEIGFSAFNGCSGLTSVSIPSSVTSIGVSAFKDCSGLTSVSIPNSVVSIGGSAFYGCSGLTSVSIPNSVTSIGAFAFYGCSGLTSVSIPNSVVSIGGSAFYGCSGLTSISISNSVTEIGDNAFDGCENLKNLRIEDGTETLVLGAKDNNEELGLFSDCPLEVLYLGRNLEYPGSDVTTNSNDTYSPFSGISSLSEVTIGSYVTEIGNYAFKGCTGLKTLRIEDGNAVLSVGVNKFTSYDKISVVAYQGLFYDCPLETLYLGRHLEYDCTPFYGNRLTELTIGSAVTSVSGISGCDGIMTIYSYATTPPWMPSFTNNQYINAKVYVPQGSLAAYQAADVWENFWGLQEFDPTGISQVEMDEDLGVTVENGSIVVENAKGRVTVYGISGAMVKSVDADGGRTEIAVPTRGIYIVKVGSKAVKVRL